MTLETESFRRAIHRLHLRSAAGGPLGSVAGHGLPFDVKPHLAAVRAVRDALEADAASHGVPVPFDPWREAK